MDKTQIIMKTLIRNGRVITPDSTINGYILYEDGVITEIGAGECSCEADEVIDAHGHYVSPGFIDIHTHGAGGADFMDGTVEAFLAASRMQASHGATLVFPTTLTSSNEILLPCINSSQSSRPLIRKLGSASEACYNATRRYV